MPTNEQNNTRIYGPEVPTEKDESPNDIALTDGQAERSPFANKRTEPQKESDRAFISEQSLRGASITKIRERLNARNAEEGRGYTLSVFTIHDDLRYVRAEWQRTMYATQDEAMQAELAKLDKREDEIWAAYNKSQEGKRKTVIEGGTISPTGVMTGGIVTKREHTTSAGDKGFLSLLKDTANQRARLLGLYGLHKIPKAAENHEEIAAADLVAKMPTDALLAVVRAMQDTKYVEVKAKIAASEAGEIVP